jgi:hypothetical protein
VGSERKALAFFTPGKDLAPIVQEAGWAPGPVWRGVENIAPTSFRSPDRSESLYRLHYPGPCPTDKPPSKSWSCTSSSSVPNTLSLFQILSHNFFFVEPVSPHFQNQALLLENDVVYALRKIFEGWCFRVLRQKRFQLQRHSQRETRCLLLKMCWFV